MTVMVFGGIELLFGLMGSNGGPTSPTSAACWAAG